MRLGSTTINKGEECHDSIQYASATSEASLLRGPPTLINSRLRHVLLSYTRITGNYTCIGSCIHQYVDLTIMSCKNVENYYKYVTNYLDHNLIKFPICSRWSEPDCFQGTSLFIKTPTLKGSWLYFSCNPPPLSERYEILNKL